MRIIQEENVNTGGGCMVYSLWIKNGGDLKSININEEVVAGCSITYDDDEGFNETTDLWVEYYDISNITALTKELCAHGLPDHIINRITAVISDRWNKYGS